MVPYPRPESPMSPAVNHTCPIKRPSNFAPVFVCPCSSGEGRRPLEHHAALPLFKASWHCHRGRSFFYYLFFPLSEHLSSLPSYSMMRLPWVAQMKLSS